MLPVAELRVGLPMALGLYNLSLAQALFFSILGNIIPVFFILWFSEDVVNFLRGKNKFVNKFFDWLFERTRNRFNEKYKKYGALALILFVAIPLPITGAWTGSLASWLFGIERKKSLLFIFIGILISALIVSLASLGILKIF